jgi:hypothetical protein
MTRRIVLSLIAVSLCALAVPAPAAASAPAATAATCAERVIGAAPLHTGRRILDPLPVGTGPCPGVRPGGLVKLAVGGCTLNYLFTGRNAAGATGRYIGTAGHCVLSSPGEQVWAPGAGPEARDAQDAVIGRVVYAVRNDTKDFALIRLHDGVEANPQLCHFGGPTGINADVTSAFTELQYYGNGLLVGATVPARTAVATGMSNADKAHAYGVTLFGDSGAAVNSSDGRAVGVAVTIGGNVDGLANTGVVGITRLAPQVQRAQGQLGLTLSLVTAPKLTLVDMAPAPLSGAGASQRPQPALDDFARGQARERVDDVHLAGQLVPGELLPAVAEHLVHVEFDAASRHDDRAHALAGA